MSYEIEEQQEIKRLEDAGKLEKEKYQEYLPEGFNENCETIRARDKAYSTEFGKDVLARYDELRKEDKIPPMSARIIVVGEFAGIRSERRLVRYLPDECKSERHRIAAGVSNGNQSETLAIKRAQKQIVEGEKAKKELHETHPEIPVGRLKPIEVNRTPEQDEDIEFTFELEARGYFIRTINKQLEEHGKIKVTVNRQGIVAIEPIKQRQAAASPAL